MNTSEQPEQPAVVHGVLLPGARPLCLAPTGQAKSTTVVRDITCDVCKQWVAHYNPAQAELLQPTADVLRKHILNEQARLWGDLSEALRMAANGVWSTGCDSKVYRLVLSMRLVGVVDMGKIQWPLIAGDVYQTICRAADVEYSDWTEEDWEVQEFRLLEYGGREYLQKKYAWTNAIIMAPCDGIKDANYERDHPDELD